MMEPAIPENEQERLNVLRELGLTSAKGEHFDALAKKVAEAFDVPIALVSLIGETSQFGRAQPDCREELEAVQASCAQHLDLRACGGGRRD